MPNGICYFISFLVEGITIWMYAETMFLPKHSPQMRVSIITILFSLLFFIVLFEKTWLNTVLFSITLFLLFLTQYELCWYTALFHTILIGALIGTTELFFYGIYNFLNPFFSGAKEFHTLIQLTIFSKLLFCFILFMIMHFFQNHQLTKDLQNRSSIHLFLVPLISLCMFLMFIYYDKKISSIPELSWLATLCAAFLLLLNLLVFGINEYNQKRHQEYVELQLLCQKETDTAEYYRALVEQNENQRILIHDIKRHLASIDALAEAGESHKIHAYIRELQESGSLKESRQYCDNHLLNAILCRYAQQCCLRQISFTTDIRSHVLDFLTDADLTALFCNLLDNALRATKELPDPFLELRAYTRENSPFVVITLVNSCKEDPFSRPGNTPVSTKPNPHRHGLGLKSVRRVIDRYQGDMKMYYDLPTLSFHTIVTLRMEKK